MFSGFKAFIVVACISYVVFRLAEPICLRYMRREDLHRRRLVWGVLTTVAFLSPSFWIYVLVAIPLMAWSARLDSNPPALYFFLYFLIPPSISIYIPVVGINQLFDLNQFRLLSLTVLLPLALRISQSKSGPHSAKLTLMDALVLSYSLLCLVQFIPYESITNTMRRALILFLDEILVYYVFSRLALDRRLFNDTLATFVLACILFAPLAFFESARSWLLYENIGERWGSANEFAFLMRGDSLRAQVSTGHALALGSMTATAFCFWLYLQSKMDSKWIRVAVSCWLWVGMLAAYSRAPWIMAGLMFFLFALLGPRGLSKFFKWSIIFTIVASLVLMSPIGDRIIDNLPFIGTVDQGNVTYRQELARLSWILIQENPFFGDPFVLENMESLRQGQGIIDLVNGFVTVALFHGMVGAFLFFGVFIVALARAWPLMRRSRISDPDFALLGASLIACMLGTLFFVATAGLSTLLYPFAGLLASYANMGSLRKVAPGRLGAERKGPPTMAPSAKPTFSPPFGKG